MDEDQLSPEQVAELKQSAEQLEALKADYAKQGEELEKLKGKDYNFRKLEESTEEEKRKSKEKVAKKEEKLTEQEQRLRDMEEGFRERQDKFFETQLSSVKKRVVQEYAGDDAELIEKMEFHAKTLIGDRDSEEGLREIYGKSHLLATGSKPQLNSIASVQGISTGYSKSKPKTFTETEAGKQSFDQWFPDLKNVRNK